MIEILVGVPGCGKSTYAKSKARIGWIVVDLDAIVTMLHGGDYTQYDENLNGLYKAIQNNIIQSALLAHLDIVVDRCNNLSSTRRQIIDLAKQFNVPVNIIYWPYCDENFDLLLSRRMKNSRGYDKRRWSEVILRIGNAMEPPTDQEVESVCGHVYIA
jgi:tRNA uridine 5-carbamoylmethylation protein Kti12